MLMTLESKVVFRARAISLGVPPDIVDASVANGWGTQG